MAGQESSANPQAIMDIKDRPAIIAHIELMQGIINRLSDKCAQCKEWCFALVGALLVFICSSDNNNQIDFKILYCIIGIFCILDAYYLGLERKMRNHYREFVKSINGESPTLFKEVLSPYGINITPTSWERFWNQLEGTICGLWSFSIILPYGFMFLITWIFHPGTTSTVN